MLISAPRTITFRGAPAVLYVLRNDGFCWGRLITSAGEVLDVSPPDPVLDGHDLYDDPDEDALDILEACTGLPACIAPAHTYLF